MLGVSLILTVIFLDQLTKFLVVHELGLNRSIAIFPNLLFFTYVQNRGIAFGLFRNGHNFLIILIICIILVLLYYTFKSYKSCLMSYFSLSLILGGALGNLIDRLRLGHVVDFIDVRFGKLQFPVFNVADCFVVLGTLLLSFKLLFTEQNSNRGECKDGDA